MSVLFVSGKATRHRDEIFPPQPPTMTASPKIRSTLHPNNSVEMAMILHYSNHIYLCNTLHAFSQHLIPTHIVWLFSTIACMFSTLLSLTSKELNVWACADYGVEWKTCSGHSLWDHMTHLSLSYMYVRHDCSKSHFEPTEDKTNYKYCNDLDHDRTLLLNTSALSVNFCVLLTLWGWIAPTRLKRKRARLV